MTESANTQVGMDRLCLSFELNREGSMKGFVRGDTNDSG